MQLEQEKRMGSDLEKGERIGSRGTTAGPFVLDPIHGRLGFHQGVDHWCSSTGASASLTAIAGLTSLIGREPQKDGLKELPGVLPKAASLGMASSWKLHRQVWPSEPETR